MASAGRVDVAGLADRLEPPDTPQTLTKTHSRRPRKVATAAAAAIGLVGLVFLLYAASIHANPGDSDGASVILEGQAMAHGHFLLHGWGLSLDSFWLVDALLYTVAVLLGGLRPGLLYAVPAILAALVIVAGVLMAREGRRGAAAVAGGAAVFVLLALPTHAMAVFFSAARFTSAPCCGR